MNCTKRLFFTALMSTVCAYSSASIIEIQLVDIDIEYDSSTGEITDAGVANDALSAAFFFLDGAPVGSLTTDLSLDLLIPGVFGIDPAGDTVFSDPGGNLELFTPSSILDLDLDSVEVIYMPFSVGPSMFEFIFAGTIGSVVGQDLPFDLKIGDPITVTLSTQANSLSASATEVESFTASGTGELIGDLDLTPDGEIPEPTSALLIALAAGLMAARRRRS